jgi:hypothetical protein
MYGGLDNAAFYFLVTVNTPRDRATVAVEFEILIIV